MASRTVISATQEDEKSRVILGHIETVTQKERKETHGVE